MPAIIAVLLQFFLNRAKEPSTYAGLGGVFLAVKQALPVEYQPLVDPAVALISGLAILIAERGKRAPVEERHI